MNLKLLLILFVSFLFVAHIYSERKEGSSQYNEKYKQYWNYDKYANQPEFKKYIHTLTNLQKAIKAEGYKSRTEKLKIEKDKYISSLKQKGKSEKEIKNMISENFIPPNSEINKKLFETINAMKNKDKKEYSGLLQKIKINSDSIDPETLDKVWKEAAGEFYRSELTKDGDFRFYYIDDEGNETFTTIVPANKVNALVKSTISNDGTNYKYQYEVINLKNSKQAILGFSIEYQKILLDYYYDRNKIIFLTTNVLKTNMIQWAMEIIHIIVQNSTMNDFYTISLGIPGIEKYYIEGLGKEGNSHSPYLRQDTFVNSVSGKTLGPVKLPWEETNYTAPNKTSAMIDRLLGYMDESFNEGWIEDVNVRDDLTNRLSEIKNNYKAGKISEAKAVLQGILDYIEPYKDTDKVILSEAYGLLKYNLEYVRDELLK